MVNCAKNRRAIVISAFATLEIFLFAGPLYGWPAMVPILVKEGYFADKCHHPPTNYNVSSYDHHCINREKNLNLVFTIAVISIPIVQFPFGIIADRVPWYKLRFIGSIGFMLSGIFWTLSVNGPSQLLFAGAALLSVSGFFLYFPLIQLINKTFTKNKSLTMSLLSCAYDSSAAVFSLIKITYDSGVSLNTIWIVYTSLGTAATVGATVLFARLKTSSERLSTNRCTENVTLVAGNRPSVTNSSSEKDDEFANFEVTRPARYQRCLIRGTLARNSMREQNDKEELRDVETRVIPEEKTIWRQLVSPTFVLQITFMCLTNLRVLSYIGNLNTTLVTRLHCDMKTASKYLSIFGITQLFALPLSVIIGPLLDGKLIRKNLPLHRKRTVGGITGLMLTNTVQLLLNIFAVTPILELQVLTFLCLITLRAFLFASNFSVLATIVPAHHYGKLASFSLSCVGIFSAVQYLLFALVEDGLNGDPLWVDIGFLLISIVLYAYPYKMYTRYTKHDYTREQTV